MTRPGAAAERGLKQKGEAQEGRKEKREVGRARGKPREASRKLLCSWEVRIRMDRGCRAVSSIYKGCVKVCPRTPPLQLPGQPQPHILPAR